MTFFNILWVYWDAILAEVREHLHHCPRKVLMPSRDRWPTPGHTATKGTTGQQCHFYSVLNTTGAWHRWASQTQAARSWQSARVEWMMHLSGRWNSHFFPWDSISNQTHIFRCGHGAFWSLCHSWSAVVLFLVVSSFSVAHEKKWQNSIFINRL